MIERGYVIEHVIFVSADYGIVAQIIETLMKRNPFIGIPYW